MRAVSFARKGRTLCESCVNIHFLCFLCFPLFLITVYLFWKHQSHARTRLVAGCHESSHKVRLETLFSFFSFFFAFVQRLFRFGERKKRRSKISVTRKMMGKSLQRRFVVRDTEGKNWHRLRGREREISHTKLASHETERKKNWKKIPSLLDPCPVLSPSLAKTDFFPFFLFCSLSPGSEVASSAKIVSSFLHQVRSTVHWIAAGEGNVFVFNETDLGRTAAGVVREITKVALLIMNLRRQPTRVWVKGKKMRRRNRGVFKLLTRKNASQKLLRDYFSWWENCCYFRSTVLCRRQSGEVNVGDPKSALPCSEKICQ